MEGTKELMRIYFIYKPLYWSKQKLTIKANETGLTG
jgi:hypothetical protein